MKKSKDTYGVPMIAYCMEHEAYIEEGIQKGMDNKELLLWHEKKLEWIQHERLVHLLVTILTAIVFLFSIMLGVYLDWNIMILPLQLILMILLGAYLHHYFKLENRVQHWYHIADELHESVKKEKSEE